MFNNRNFGRPTGGPFDHRPNERSKIMSLRWSIGPSSIWTVKFCKFEWSKLRHSDQVAFLFHTNGLISAWPAAGLQHACRVQRG